MPTLFGEDWVKTAHSMYEGILSGTHKYTDKTITNEDEAWAVMLKQICGQYLDQEFLKKFEATEAYKSQNLQDFYNYAKDVAEGILTEDEFTSFSSNTFGDFLSLKDEHTDISIKFEVLISIISLEFHKIGVKRYQSNFK